MNRELKINDVRDFKYFVDIEAVKFRKRDSYLPTWMCSCILSVRISLLPLDQNLKWSKDDNDAIPNLTMCRILIVKLLYLTIAWPDSVYTV